MPTGVVLLCQLHLRISNSVLLLGDLPVLLHGEPDVQLNLGLIMMCALYRIVQVCISKTARLPFWICIPIWGCVRAYEKAEISLERKERISHIPTLIRSDWQPVVLVLTAHFPCSQKYIMCHCLFHANQMTR